MQGTHGLRNGIDRIILADIQELGDALVVELIVLQILWFVR